MKSPLVSIIIPNFNKESFVKETLLSLEAQSYKNFEVIIVDDASTDNSVGIIQDFIKNDSRFQLIQQPLSRGGSMARNLGFAVAKGEYVIFLDSDDLISPLCLENRVNEFLRSKSDLLDFIISPMECFKHRIGDTHEKWLPRSADNHLLDFLSHHISWQTMQPIWRYSFLEALKFEGNSGPFDDEYPRLQDVEMHTRALLAGGRYKILEDAVPDCYYRIDLQRAGASRENQLSRQIQGFCQYLTKIGKMVSSRGRKYKAALRLTYFEALVTLCYWRNKREVSARFETEKIADLNMAAMSSSLLSVYHRLIVRLYVLVLHGRVKGINWLMRKLLTAI